MSTYDRRPAREAGEAASSFGGGRRLDHRLTHLLERAADYERASGPTTPPSDLAAAIELRDVTTEVDGIVVLDRIALRLPAGRRSAIVGLTGPGKGAFVEQILGRRWPSAGDVIVLGESTAVVQTEDDQTALARRIGVVLRDGGLFSSWSVFDNVAVLLRNEHGIEETHIARLVEEILDEVGLTGQAALLPEALAIGQRKRCGIARALVAAPEIVIIDELEAGVDEHRAELLAELIVHLHARRGGTFLSFTQDLAAATATAEEIVLISRGRLVGRGSPADLARSANPHIRALMGG